LRLADTLVETGRPHDALEVYQGLIGARQSGIAAEALFSSARVLRDLARQQRRAADMSAAEKNLKEARRRLKRLVLLYSFEQLAPLPQRAWLELAELEAETERTDAAIAALNDLIEAFPESPHALYARARADQLRGRPNEAEVHLRKLKAHDQPLPDELAQDVARLTRELEARR
ncbi:MAG: tetratricopeptide repeat protein, partial [Phycisphaeraceae bacterium]|nr:tetratricopeptide repeat protein [Phycisphaeraceae bacterium]